MKLWMSGRIDHDIEDSLFRTVLNEVEHAVNSVIEGKSYGSSIESWDVIIVIYKERTGSVFKYNARTKETDIEIPIDYQKFKKGDVENGKKLFFSALVLSLQKLMENKKIIDFDFQEAIDDITNIAKMK